MRAPVHRRQEDSEPLEVLGLEIRILLPAAATDGALAMFEERDGPGDGPPLHIHHDADEVFAVLEGRYRFRIGETVLEAGAGDALVVPRGTPHTFMATGAGRLLVTMRPGGFEGFFHAVAEAGLDVPGDIEEIARIGARHGLEFLGPNPLAG